MNTQLSTLRLEIDEVDEGLINLLKKRLQIVDKVGRYKKANSIPPLDKNRWEEVVEKNMRRADDAGLRREFIREILDIIHAEALRIEEIIKNEK